MARETSKSVKSTMMLRKLERCNPFDKNDKDILSSGLKQMPNSKFIYSEIRGKYIKDIDEMSMENWATGDSGKHKFPELEIACLMVHTQKYLIPYLIEEGESKEDILFAVKSMGFLNAALM